MKRVSDSEGGIETETVLASQRKRGVIRRWKSSEEGEGEALLVVMVKERQRDRSFGDIIILRIHKSSSFSIKKKEMWC